jgi:hypothetical protein
LSIGKISNSNIPLHHFPKLSAQKNRYYLQLLEKKAISFPNANTYAELSVQYLENGDELNAIKYAKKANLLNPRIKIKV